MELYQAGPESQAGDQPGEPGKTPEAAGRMRALQPVCKRRVDVFLQPGLLHHSQGYQHLLHFPPPLVDRVNFNLRKMNPSFFPSCKRFTQACAVFEHRHGEFHFGVNAMLTFPTETTH